MHCHELLGVNYTEKHALHCLQRQRRSETGVQTAAQPIHHSSTGVQAMLDTGARTSQSQTAATVKTEAAVQAQPPADAAAQADFATLSDAGTQAVQVLYTDAAEEAAVQVWTGVSLSAIFGTCANSA